MKLNWFSPVPPARSAIAENLLALLPAMAKKADITVWVHEPNWAADLEAHARVIQYKPDSLPWAEINAADMTIYHLGNHPEFHAPIWRVYRQQPGIVVLHDLSLQHLFAGMVFDNLGLSRGEYADMMQFHHAAIGREAAVAVLSGLRRADDIAQDCPLTGAAVDNALGVAVHTDAGASRVRLCTTVPVVYVPLFPPAENGSRNKATQPSQRNAEVFRIIMFGYLGPNRRLNSILTALRDFPQKHRFHLDIYGTITDGRTVRQAIAQFGLGDVVTVHGFVPADELTNALSCSHLALNLRDPTMGEASASQLRIWQHELPSLVTDTGWYATLPPGTVATVRRTAELEDIRAHLTKFLAEPETYRAIGRQGRKYLQERHTVEAYLDSLFELVRLSRRNQPAADVSWMAGRAGRAIRPWFSDGAAGVLLPRLAKTISSIYDN